MAARGIRITAIALGTALLLLGMVAVSAILRPRWVSQWAEGQIRNYLIHNPLSDSARVEFESIEWIPVRGIRIKGLHVHRNLEGVKLGEITLLGLSWQNGGLHADSVDLDSVQITGTPSADWLHWFDAWIDTTTSDSTPLVLSVGSLHTQFMAQSVEGDTLVSWSTFSVDRLQINASEWSLHADMALQLPAVGSIDLSADVRSDSSYAQLSYDRYRLGVKVQSDSVRLKLEDDSLNSLSIKILKVKDQWSIPRQRWSWNGTEGSASAIWGPQRHTAELDGYGLQLRLAERNGDWTLDAVGDSLSSSASTEWHVHGRARASVTSKQWRLASQGLWIRASDQRLHFRSVEASGSAEFWKAAVTENTYGSLSANGNYAAERVNIQWKPVHKLQLHQDLPSVTSVQATWSLASPWNATLVAKDSLATVGSALARWGETSQEWTLKADLGDFTARAVFTRTPNEWKIPELHIHQWAQQALTGQLVVLDSLGLRDVEVQGPMLHAFLKHELGRTQGSALWEEGSATATWLYSSHSEATEHSVEWKGSESARIRSVYRAGDSLRIALSGHADHPRGGRADVEVAVWPIGNQWTGRLKSGSIAAWYRPEDGEAEVALDGPLSGASRWTYHFDHKRFALEEPLFWSSPQGQLAIGGSLSPNEGEVLRVQALHVDVPFWSQLAGLSAAELGGRLRLDAVVVGELSGWAVSGGIRSEGATLKGQPLGDLSVDLDFLPDSDRTTLKMNWVHRDTTVLNVVGELDSKHFSAETQTLNLPVRWARPFADGAVDDLDGRIRGRATCSSKADFSDLTWSGSGFWTHAALALPSVGLGLKSTTAWALDPDGIRIGPARWADHRGVGSAEITANVRFTGSQLVDLTFKTERMVVLDLQPNPDFYGYVVGSGTGRLYGSSTALKLDVKAKTSDSSVFVLPLDAPSSLEEVEFLHFKTRNAPTAVRKRIRNPDDFRFDLHLDLDVTPDVLARLILDETVGDVIEARGSGPLQLDVPWVGDMALRGNLVLNRGTYLFTLQNLINKPFSLLPGGTLNWTGDPYAAQMDLTAVYKTRADVRDYLSLPEAGRQNVDVRMHATGPLFQPQLGFEIGLPNAGEIGQAALSSRLSYPDERTTQVLSLLTISSFWVGSSPLAAQGMQAVESNTTQVLASQFTNFMTQGLGADWDVNLAYSANTAAAQREMEASIGRSFMDDRLSIQTEWGIPIGQSQPSIGLGDVEVRYQLSDDGRWSAKAYQRRNDQNTQTGVVGSQRQGVGLRWEQSGSTWRDVLRVR